jgi:phage-related protein
MPLSRPRPSVSSGVEELRIWDGHRIYRAFYYAKSAQGILVFRAFVKKNQARPKREPDLGKRRLKELLHEKI